MIISIVYGCDLTMYAIAHTRETHSVVTAGKKKKGIDVSRRIKI